MLKELILLVVFWLITSTANNVMMPFITLLKCKIHQFPHRLGSACRIASQRPQNSSVKGLQK
jgi:hypothetical protein